MELQNLFKKNFTFSVIILNAERTKKVKGSQTLYKGIKVSKKS